MMDNIQYPLRPSLLPKLAQCRCFIGSRKPAGAPAIRGTKLDTILRNLLAGNAMDDIMEANHLNPLEKKDKEALEWGLARVRKLAKGTPIITAETHLLAPSAAPSTISAGTMDCHLPERGIIIDFKTGQLYSYREQMAAYCLSMMNKYHCDSYKAICLFIDQQDETLYHFTREEAEALINHTVKAQLEPTSCEYCKWCGNIEVCPLTQKAITETEQIVTKQELQPLTDEAIKAKTKEELADPQNPYIQELVDNPDKCQEFFTNLKAINAFGDIAKARIKEDMARCKTLKRGGFTIFDKKGKNSVPASTLLKHRSAISYEELMAALGSLSVTKFEQLATKCGLIKGKDYNPETDYTNPPSYTELRFTPIKKQLTNKKK